MPGAMPSNTSVFTTPLNEMCILLSPCDPPYLSLPILLFLPTGAPGLTMTK